MQFTEEKAAEVKSWVVKKLEDISDADSEVLADYVLALISTDAPDDEIRKASVENLEDFLKENTVPFVDEIFEKFHPKPEQPGLPDTTQQLDLPPPVQDASFSQPPPNVDMMAQFAQVQLGAMGQPGLARFDNNDQQFNARKRTFNDSQGDDQGPYQRNADRPHKSARGRRGRGGIGGWDNRQTQSPHGQGYSPNMPGGFRGGPGTPQPGFPPFNPNDPIAQMLSMSGINFPQIPGMPPMPPLPSLNGQSQPSGSPPNKIAERCKNYDNMGFCVLGSTCPYQHGQAPSKDDEYDPTKSNIVSPHSANGANGHGSGGRGDRGRGRGRGRNDRGGHGSQRRNRAEFSHAGPNEDRRITTIVVEQIPEDKFDEATVREFFSEFGEITEVTMKPYKHLALVKYDSYDAAHRAWSSPKVIFDNRFVKVYWYKPTESRGDSNGLKKSSADEPSFDMEAFEKQQAEAQKAHEEKIKKRKETEEAILEHKKKTEELLKRHKEEQAKLLQKLEAKGAGKDTASPESGTPTNDKTASLRAQLASLEAEAKSMGIDPNAQPESSFGRGRGRGYGGFRGRGGFAPRGRGYDPSFRGGFRGRGAFRGRGGVIRLDNRPKKVAISGVEFDTNRDEALRQYLLGIGEYESIDPSPDRPGALVVSFKDRYVAEKLFHGPSDIPSVGNVEFAWVANPPQPSTQPPGATVPKSSDDVAMADSNAPGAAAQEKEPTHEVDYDVAEMDDSWAE
ncbi:CCCH zinc finger and RRM domain-containing protein [Nannizzia gypsea CBS 118893]|uniref:CCCH zinc finger and RRM domain-containing protein n=1 Tax=Arthroderma gypseum (strain ATCC MYA-4604 / CBS 118893) TaxID=535722 RepID=E4UQT1_ARTGP|nr:CCCH zinc finger and RRM domain-containing protein [Nannizzia gypsea CBS 118893]EFR00099.1 CCCH zinc finger and RRM domain-containing protein [Nannizzia gypsea CBS 118893]